MMRRILIGCLGSLLAFVNGFIVGSVINVYASGFGGGGLSFPILAADGTLAAPSYAWATEPGTGMRYSSALNYRFSFNGTDYYNISYTGLNGPSGSATLPGLSNFANGTSGLAWQISTNALSHINNFLETVRWDATGREYFKRNTSVPTMGACGTSPSVTVGQDNAMLVTVGTGGVATSCAVNFGAAYLTNAPICTVQNDTDKVAYSIVTSTTVLTITATAAFTASSKFHVRCTGVL